MLRYARGIFPWKRWPDMSDEFREGFQARKARKTYLPPGLREQRPRKIPREHAELAGRALLALPATGDTPV